MSAIQQVLFMGKPASGGAAYRYYRLNISQSTGGSFLIIAEVELRATVGGADLTSPSTPVTQSWQDGSDSAGRMVVDNDTNTTWNASLAGPWWIRMDLGTPQSVAQVKITRLNSTPGYNGSPFNFNVEGSNDGTSFTVLGTFPNVDWSFLTERTFNL